MVGPGALTESPWERGRCHAHILIPWGLLGELVHRILVSTYLEGKKKGEFSKVRSRTGSKSAGGGGSSPHTLTLALGALPPGSPAEEVQKEKSTRLDAPQDIESKNLSELRFSSIKRRSQQQLLLCP